MPRRLPRRDLDRLLIRAVEARLDDIQRQLRSIERNQERLMAKAEDFTVVAARIQADLAKIADDIKTIQGQAGGIQPTDLDGPLAALSAAADAMESLDSSLQPPPPPPPPPAS